MAIKAESSNNKDEALEENGDTKKDDAPKPPQWTSTHKWKRRPTPLGCGAISLGTGTLADGV